MKPTQTYTAHCTSHIGVKPVEATEADIVSIASPALILGNVGHTGIRDHDSDGCIIGRLGDVFQPRVSAKCDVEILGPRLSNH